MGSNLRLQGLIRGNAEHPLESQGVRVILSNLGRALNSLELGVSVDVRVTAGEVASRRDSAALISRLAGITFIATETPPLLRCGVPVD